ncbi:hypothetical protein ACWD4V_13545 [Streptomyces tsukubensis]
MTDTPGPRQAPVYVGRGPDRRVQLHFRKAAGYEDLPELHARRLVFDLADLLGLTVTDTKLPGEVAE